MEALIAFLIILFIALPLVFYLSLRHQVQNRSNEIREELERTRQRLEGLEKAIGKEEEREAPKSSESESPPSSSNTVTHEAEAGEREEERKDAERERKGPDQKEGEQEKNEERTQGEEWTQPSGTEEKSVPLSSDQAVLESEQASSPERPKREKKEIGSQRGRKSEWERFIGENLINKIGIGILVLGIAFFVKYAIDQGWLGEVGRVVVGILSGTALIGLAHRLRDRFKAFSSVLAGGGLAVLYFTITIAFQEYRLFSQSAAFLLMVVITTFAVLLSLLYDKQELAVIALLGGFGTPFMVSSGEGSYLVLFSYLIVLNLGMLALAYQRHWTLLNLLSYLATIAIYGSWYLQRIAETPVELPFPEALLFATAFFLIFYLMTLAYKVRKGLSFQAHDLGVLISCNALYFAVGLSILHFVGLKEYQGLFTVGVAGVNFAFALRYYRMPSVDRNLFYALVGLVLTFITLAAPIQLEGDRITLFWAAEAVLLLWLSQRSGISLLRIGSTVVNVLMLISLLMDWQDFYGPILANDGGGLRILANPAFVTGLVCIASFGLTHHLLQKEKEASFYKSLPLHAYRNVVLTAFLLLVYLIPMLDLYAQTEQHIGDEAFRSILTGSYHFLIGGLLLDLAYRKAPLLIRSLSFLAAVLLTLSYVLFYQNRISELLKAFLQHGGIELGDYAFHFLLIGGFLLVLDRSWALLKSIETRTGEFRPVFRWYATFMIVFMMSLELERTVLWIGSGSDMGPGLLREWTSMIGYPILWGLTSFFLMWKGLRKRIRNLRIISLTLFALILFKLFVLDIQDIPEVGRVIAFISLGTLLLVVSFMYQKLKGIVLDPSEERDE